MNIGTTSPHSRACGFQNHDHGSDCHSNCPTCHGEVIETKPVTTSPAEQCPECGGNRYTRSNLGPYDQPCPACHGTGLAPRAQTAAVHLGHCYQGQNEDNCKYGEDDCPAGCNSVPQAKPDTTSPELEQQVRLITGSWYLSDEHYRDVPSTVERDQKILALIASQRREELEEWWKFAQAHSRGASVREMDNYEHRLANLPKATDTADTNGGTHV